MNRRIPPPTQFLNRELGILAFQRRVLAQAADDAVPLLERMRFITIVSSNLDEFFRSSSACPSPAPTAAGRARCSPMWARRRTRSSRTSIAS